MSQRQAGNRLALRDGAGRFNASPGRGIVCASSLSKGDALAHRAVMVAGIVDSYDLGNRLCIPFENGLASEVTTGESANPLPIPVRIEDEQVDVVLNPVGEKPGLVRLSVELASLARSLPGDEQFRDQSVKQPSIRERQRFAQDATLAVRRDSHGIERTADVGYSRYYEPTLRGHLDDLRQRNLPSGPTDQRAKHRFRDRGTLARLQQHGPPGRIVHRLPERERARAASHVEGQADQNKPDRTLQGGGLLGSLGSARSSRGKVPRQARDASGEENVPSGIGGLRNSWRNRMSVRSTSDSRMITRVTR